MATLYDRIAGTVYGQFVGDALGARYEFKNPKDVSKMLKEDSTDENFIPILGGGPFKLSAGSVTDDTEMGFGLMLCIIKHNGYNQHNVAKKYIKWFKSVPFDMGKTTNNALKDAKDNYDIIDNSNRFNRGSLSNGCLMRAFSLGILASKLDDENIYKLAKLDCILTNPDDFAVNAVAVFIGAVGELIKTKDKNLAFERALRLCKHKLLKDHIVSGSKGSTTVKVEDNGKFINIDIHGGFQGYLGIPIQLCFYELFHGDSFYDSLIRTVGRGGDADTNACIVGSFLGAYYGVENIPERWKSTVRRFDNPRKEIYPDIDQTKIDENIDKIYSLVR